MKKYFVYDMKFNLDFKKVENTGHESRAFDL